MYLIIGKLLMQKVLLMVHLSGHLPSNQLISDFLSKIMPISKELITAMVLSYIKKNSIVMMDYSKSMYSLKN